MNPYLKTALYHFAIALIIVVLWGMYGCATLPQLRCSENAIICAKILEREGYTARVAYGDWLGKGYPPGTDHAQCFTLDGEKKTWWVLLDNTPVKTNQHNFRVEYEITWQEAIYLWWLE